MVRDKDKDVMKAKCTLLLTLSILPTFVLAGVEEDISTLIKRVEQSSCTFIRNGKTYTNQEAAEHMRNKWDYAKDDVDSVDVFIKEVASKSWLSGKPYWVDCQDKRITSEEWLTSLMSTTNHIQ
ncbi:YfeK family protein [Vibrio rotiferianus]